MSEVLISTGMIVLFNGAVVDIPSGYQLCDGTNGTPDLRDRFVLCAGGMHAVDSTGGQETHTHTGSGSLVDADLDVGTDVNAGGDYSNSLASEDVTLSINSANHMPPYYCLAFIMKL